MDRKMPLKGRNSFKKTREEDKLIKCECTPGT